MNKGQVYLPAPPIADPRDACVVLATVSLPRLGREPALDGQFVRVRNGALVNTREAGGGVILRPVGDCAPDSAGDYIHFPGRGGTRVDRALLVNDHRLAHYVETSHFAEVNTYFHIDRMAAYVHELLAELGAGPLPKVVAVVHAHNAAVQPNQTRDGVHRRGGWAPFQGGHYRLPATTYDVCEHQPISPDGEVHLGAGRRRLVHGALARFTNKPYRHNAGHNAGIIYHEFAHHVNRHTADFRDNKHRPPDAQKNRKVALDEGTSDYWAAVMLESPYIWAWHRRNDSRYVHPRSLTSRKTMEDYDRRRKADPHANGTIWAAALWDARTRLAGASRDGGRTMDRIVLRAMLSIGRTTRSGPSATCRVRARFGTGLEAVLDAERLISGGAGREIILSAFAARGIHRRRASEIIP